MVPPAPGDLAEKVIGPPFLRLNLNHPLEGGRSVIILPLPEASDTQQVCDDRTVGGELGSPLVPAF
jgi:hypothetical protein